MANGFKKLNISNGSSERKFPTKEINSRNLFKIIGFSFIGCFIFLIIFSIFVFIPAKDLYLSVQKVAVSGKEAWSAFKNQDIELASLKLETLDKDLSLMKQNLSRLNWIGFVPVIGVYQKDAQHVTEAIISSVEAAKIAVETITPYADLLGLKGQSTFVAGSADERIKTAVETLDKMVPSVDKIAEKISLAQKELEKVDYQRYPEKIGKTNIRERIKNGKDLFDETASLFVEAQPLLKNIPDLMGVAKPKRYLVLFQNDAELRATGGFITAYALFKVDKGKFQVERADDIYKLDEAKRKKFEVPSPILKYHKNVFVYHLRDSNLSPDFLVSMKEFEKMLGEAGIEFPDFDGIIALDTHVLVSTIKILGDFNVYGRNFTAETDKRCDCPKAIYELEDYATKPVAYVREDRKDIIGVLLYQMMQRALGVSPSQYWGKIFQTFLNEAREKHVLFYFHNQEAQKGIEALKFGGRLESFDGDYLHVNDVNFAGAKSNIFVKHTIKQEVEVEDDGGIKKTLTISYKNPSPPSNCNLEAGQLCLNGILRNWLRIYTPKGSTLISFNGSEKETVVYEESDKAVFEGFLTVKPQGASEVKVVYKLPFKVQRGQEYKLFFQKQPGTNNHEFVLIIKGKEVEKGQLTTDRIFSFKL